MQVKSFMCDHPNLHKSNMAAEPYQEKLLRPSKILLTAVALDKEHTEELF